MEQKLALPLLSEMNNISFEFIDIEIPDFDPVFLCAWINEIAQKENIVLEEIQYVFCSDEELLKINRESLNHDYYTDIITFNYNEEDSCAGDLFISYDRVKENAKDYGNGNVHDELCRVMAHGILHLIGFDDKLEEDRLVIRKKEEECLKLREIVSRETNE